MHKNYMHVEPLSTYSEMKYGKKSELIKGNTI